MNRTAVVIIATALVGLAGAAGYWLGLQEHPDESASPGTPPGEREILYWYDPMYPDRRFDAPGKSPFMDMQLVPKYADEVKGAGIRIDPEVVQNLGVRVATAVRTTLERRLEAVGTLEFDDREVAVVQSRSGGFVDRVYDRAPADLVEKGAPLVDLLVPEWRGAQREFLTLLETNDEALIDAGRERLRLLGMPEALIRRVEQSREVNPVHTIETPIGGTIQSLEVRQGMTVQAGETLARINGLDTVWLEVAVPEAQAEWLSAGAPVRARLTALPDHVLNGKVVAVLPAANPLTRTLTVRIELSNPSRQLRPGMFARAEIGSSEQQAALTVPTEAVIRTGERTLVMLSLDGGRFQPAEIVPGPESGDRMVVLRGLREGEKVVVSGQFLLDSEASLRGIEARPVQGDGEPEQHEHGAHGGSDLPIANSDPTQAPR